MNLKFESMGKIKDFPISDIVGKFIVFKQDFDSNINDIYTKINYLNSDLTFGYVFPLKEEGLLVAEIATGFLDENNIVTIEQIAEIPEYKLLPQKNAISTVKFDDIENCDFIFTDNLSSDLKEKYYQALPFIQDKKIEKLYQIKELDKFRDEDNHLIVNVNDLKIKLENSGDYGFVGKILDNSNSRVILKLFEDELIIDDNFSNKNNSDIILEILSKLSGSSSFNKRYLKNKFFEFKDKPEVIEVIFDKYSKQLNGIDKEIFITRKTKYFDEIIDKCDEFIELSKIGESKKALKLIQEYISQYSCDEDYVIDYFEKDIFAHFFNCACFIGRQDLAILFRCLGVILNDNGLKEDALNAFKKAYYINPVNVDTLIELAVCYLDIDLEKCKSTLNLGFKYAYTYENFNQLYHVLEEYYYRTGKLEEAEAVSNALDGDFKLAHELDIPIDFNEDLLKMIMAKLEHHIHQNNRESVQYYLSLLIGTRNCEVLEMSDGFSKFLEIEYIDF